MAIDDVAPRAKMNLPRSRHFRAAKESLDKREELKRIIPLSPWEGEIHSVNLLKREKDT